VIETKILVIEDSQIFNKAVSEFLEKQGYVVTRVFNLHDAKEAHKAGDFNYIILDIILPDGEGDEFIEYLPTQKERSKVIVLTADDDVQRREYIFQMGVLDYISKMNPLNLILEDTKKLIDSVERNKSLNLLIVDDSSFVRRLLKKVLTPKKYNIKEARSAEVGLAILKSEEIHLVLLDYEMPKMNGLQMLEKMKRDPKIAKIPVLMLSGVTNPEIVSKVLKHGANDFISKPFVNEELLLKCNIQLENYLNIQDMQQKEEALQEALIKVTKMEKFKSMFLANMSHEIRTPINAILGFVDILEESEEDAKKLSYLQTIKASGDLLINLINDILDNSKIESGKLSIHREVFSLSELYNSIASLYEPMIQKKNIEFVKNIDKNVPKYLKSDLVRIKQILTNLFSNALKFTPENGKISFYLELSEDEEYVKFIVKDTGIGIDPSNHRKIFQLFTQAEETTTKNFGGTGLGLSISSKLATLLDGKIELESQLNKGASFIVYVPIINIEEEELQEIEKENKTVDGKSSFDSKVLLVEDNLTNQMYMSIILEELGISFDIAGDGYEALDAYTLNVLDPETQKYALILMDENMPNMNGSEATKHIRALEEDQELYHTPIVALTANALEGDRERFLAAGMDEYLTKPINKERLIEVFNLYL